MSSTYRTMTTEHLGPDATDGDLAEFVALCEEARALHPEMNDDELTDALFGDGDYFHNARRLGVDVKAIARD